MLKHVPHVDVHEAAKCTDDKRQQIAFARLDIVMLNDFFTYPNINSMGLKNGE